MFAWPALGVRCVVSSYHIRPLFPLTVPSVESREQIQPPLSSKGRGGAFKIVVVSLSLSRSLPSCVRAFAHAHTHKKIKKPRWTSFHPFHVRRGVFPKGMPGIPRTVLLIPDGLRCSSSSRSSARRIRSHTSWSKKLGFPLDELSLGPRQPQGMPLVILHRL